MTSTATPTASTTTPVATIFNHSAISTSSLPYETPPSAMPTKLLEDGSVLKKIVSFTLDKISNAENSVIKAARPSYVPEKLNFTEYERFEGKSFNLFLLSLCHFYFFNFSFKNQTKFFFSRFHSFIALSLSLSVISLLQF